jgi:hypothetical protein
MNQHAAMGEEYLVAAGWREGRTVSTERYERLYLEEGYAWVPELAGFLREFGGLKFGSRNGEFADDLNVEPEMAFDAVSKDRMDEYSEFLKKEIFPIGMSFQIDIIVAMSRDGSFYGVFDDYIGSFGNGIRELLGHLIMGTVSACADPRGRACVAWFEALRTGTRSMGSAWPGPRCRNVQVCC